MIITIIFMMTTMMYAEYVIYTFKIGFPHSAIVELSLGTFGWVIGMIIGGMVG